MKARNLSNALRDQIVYNVAKVAKARLEPAWNAKQYELFLPIYRSAVSEEQEKIARQLSNEWIDYEAELVVRLVRVEAYERLMPNDSYHTAFLNLKVLSLNKTYPVNKRIRHGHASGDFGKLKEADELEKAYFEYHNGVRAAWLPVKQALHAYRTIDALLKDLPELKEFVPEPVGSKGQFAIVSLQTIEQARAKLKGLIPINPPQTEETAEAA